MKNITLIILTTLFSLSLFSQSKDSIVDLDTTVYAIVEVMPEFSGGEAKLFEYLSKNFKFESCYFENRVRSTLYFEFIVEKNGKISNAKIIKGKSCMDEELIKTIENMPTWKPGKQRGKPVRVKFVVPLRVHPK